MPVAPAATELPSPLRDLYDHVVHVLDRHLAITRPTPLTSDLVDETLHSFQALDALVEPLRLPQFDLQTADGRLMDAVCRLNQQIPGVALRTLWHVFEYLSTSDDDGVETRRKALRIIQNLGLPVRDELTRVRWEEIVSIFPPLP